MSDTSGGRTSCSRSVVGRIYPVHNSNPYEKYLCNGGRPRENIKEKFSALILRLRVQEN